MKIPNLNKVRQFASKNPEAKNAFLAFSFFTAVFLVSPFINVIFDFTPKIKDFSSHVVSNATVNDLNISGRVSNFYNLFLWLALLTVSVFWLLYRSVGNHFNKKQDWAEALKILQNTSVIGIACVFAGFLLIDTSFATIFVFLFGIFQLLHLGSRKTYLHRFLPIWALLVSFPIVDIFYLFLDRKNFYDKLDKGISIEKVLLPVDVKMICLAVIYFCTALAVWHLGARLLRNVAAENQTRVRNALFSASLPMLVVAIFESVLLEFFNTLNLRFNYIFNSPLKLYVLLAMVAVAWSAWRFSKFRQQEKYASVPREIIGGYYYPLMLLNFGMLVFQPWRMISPENEFFEFANHGISVDHFFRYGSIPIVETFDAHMMSNEFFAYLYGILNGYEPFAPFLYIGYFTVINYLVIYYLLKKAINPTVAFLTVAAFPLLSLFDNHFTLSAIMAFMIIRLLREQSLKNFYYFWIAGLSLAMYKLDVGFSSILAALVTYFAIHYLLNKTFAWRKMLVSGIVSVGVLLALFCLLCLVRSVNPVSRLYEFLIVSMSNQNWAIAKMGDASLTIFRLVNYLLPMALFLLFGWTVTRLVFDSKFAQKIRTSGKAQYLLVFFVFFSGFFFFNIPRGIVRHTLEYGVIKQIISTIPVAILMFILLFRKRHKLMVFFMTYFGLYLIVSLTGNSLKNREAALLTTAITAPNFKEKFQEAYEFKGTRVRIGFDTSEIANFKSILDKVLKPNETYFDFASKNYYHALTARKNPLYVNQTPLMLNGDKSQELALEQIQKAKPPIVLMPIKGVFWSEIDGVNVTYKYFRISEYIYKNYSPIMRMASFDIYALNSKKDEYRQKLSKDNQESGNITVTDFSFFEKPTTNISVAQLSKDTDGKYLVSNHGTDSYISGVMAGLKAANVLKADNNAAPVTFRFNLNPASTGNVKFYYIFNEGEAYSENNVKVFQVDHTGSQDMAIDLPKMPHEFMIGVNTSNVKFNTLNIIRATQNTSAQPETIDYWLGETPRVWAEKSADAVFSKVSALGESITESSLLFDKKQIQNDKKPFYLYIEADSPVDMMAKVSLVDANADKANFHFTIKPGMNRYAVRLSANYYWWNSSSEAKISFHTDQPLIISKMALIGEDGNEEIRYKNNNLSLSNISDVNWYGGVGISNNKLLMDYSPDKERQLKGASKILLGDGSEILLDGFDIVGKYIHVRVKGNAADYRQSAAYPNTIVISK